MLVERKKRFGYCLGKFIYAWFLTLSKHSSKNSCVLKNTGLEVRSHRVSRARHDTYFTKSKKIYFSFAPSPYPRDRTALDNSPASGP